MAPAARAALVKHEGNAICVPSARWTQREGNVSGSLLWEPFVDSSSPRRASLLPSLLPLL